MVPQEGLKERVVDETYEPEVARHNKSSEEPRKDGGRGESIEVPKERLQEHGVDVTNEPDAAKRAAEKSREEFRKNGNQLVDEYEEYTCLPDAIYTIQGALGVSGTFQQVREGIPILNESGIRNMYGAMPYLKEKGLVAYKLPFPNQKKEIFNHKEGNILLEVGYWCDGDPTNIAHPKKNIHYAAFLASQSILADNNPECPVLTIDRDKIQTKEGMAAMIKLKWPAMKLSEIKSAHAIVKADGSHPQYVQEIVARLDSKKKKKNWRDRQKKKKRREEQRKAAEASQERLAAI